MVMLIYLRSEYSRKLSLIKVLRLWKLRASVHGYHARVPIVTRDVWISATVISPTGDLERSVKAPAVLEYLVLDNKI